MQVSAGISAEGNINMLQGLQMHRPALLDEPLNVRGAFDVRTALRGRRVDTDVWFEDQQGQRVISARRTSLKPDQAATDKGGAGERPQPVVADIAELQLASTYSLTPECVKAYSMEGNSIHYEQEAAERAGFRAPLIGGMGVHYWTAVMAALHTSSFQRRCVLPTTDLGRGYNRRCSRRCWHLARSGAAESRRGE